MDVFHYLDKESPEINSALQCGFRRNDTNAVGRALIEEIQARKHLVKQLATSVVQIEQTDRATIASNETVNQLKTQVAKQEAELAEVKRKLNADETGDAETTEDITGLQHLVNNLQVDINSANNAINLLVGHLNKNDEQVNANFAELQNRINSLEAKLNIADAKIDDLIDTLSALFQGLSQGSNTLPE